MEGKRTFKELVARLEEIFDEDDNTADIDAIKEAMDSCVPPLALPCLCSRPRTITTAGGLGPA